MKFLLLYYTGTYHTRYLTSMLKRKLGAAGHLADCFDITEGKALPDASSYDWIGIGYPIYAFNSPKLLDRFLKRAELPSGKRYFIYKQSGETFSLNNASSRTVKKIMKKKGCEILNEYHFVMPYNIHFRYDDAFVKELLKYDERLIDVALYEILHGIRRSIPCTISDRINSFFYSIQRPGASINSLFYRVDPHKCIRCDACVRTCPVSNIYIKDGRIRFHSRCQMCMRCSMLCPENAIRIGLLEGWKVNGAYPFEKILHDEAIPDTYVADQKQKFYRCFRKSFSEIDRMHETYFPNDPAASPSDAIL